MRKRKVPKDGNPVVARTVEEFCQAYGATRSLAYKLLKDGLIVGRKVGKRTLIDEKSAIAWYRALPCYGINGTTDGRLRSNGKYLAAVADERDAV